MPISKGENRVGFGSNPHCPGPVFVDLKGFKTLPNLNEWLQKLLKHVWVSKIIS